MLYDYSRRTAGRYECRFMGVSLAWIDPQGKVHVMRGGMTHDEWAEEQIDDAWDLDASVKLMERGWIRVSNLLVWQMINPSSAAKKTAVDWMIHCATEKHLDLERPNIMVERREGDMDVYSPADFVKRLGGQQAENRLFQVFYDKWPLRAASSRFDCNPLGTSLAWIDPQGKIYSARGGHHGFAVKYLDSLGDDYDGYPTVILTQRGWVRVVNAMTWEFPNNLSSAAKKTIVEWLTHCAVARSWDPEEPQIDVEWGPMNLRTHSIADLVRKLGGMQAENRLFDLLYPRVASYSYDRRIARQVIALRQKALLSLLAKGGTFGVISGYRPGSKHQNKLRHGDLLADLQRLGYSRWTDLRSKWEGVPEKSVLVPGIQPRHLFDLMRKYNQDAVIYKSRDGVIGLYYQDGYAEVAVDASGDPAFEMAAGEDLYSKVRHDWSFEFGFLWGHKIKYDGVNPVSRQEAKAAVLAQAA